MRDNIYILTGEIHSGKTTAISTWINSRNDVFGILTPDIDGCRYFVDAHTKERFKMTADKDEHDVLEIGKYAFSCEAFKKASAILRQASTNTSGWIVVDEIGPLELMQKGFYATVKDILSDDNRDLKKILVVRQSLVEQVISFFKMQDYEIVNPPIDL